MDVNRHVPDFGLVRGEFLPNTANLLLHVPPGGWEPLPSLPPPPPPPPSTPPPSLEPQERRSAAAWSDGADQVGAGTGATRTNTFILSDELLQQIMMMQPRAQSGAPGLDPKQKAVGTAAAGIVENKDKGDNATIPFTSSAEKILDAEDDHDAVVSSAENPRRELLSEIFVDRDVGHGWRRVSHGRGIYDLKSTGMTTTHNRNDDGGDDDNNIETVICALVPAKTFGELRFVMVEKNGLSGISGSEETGGTAAGGSQHAGLPVASSVVEFDVYVARPPPSTRGPGGDFSPPSPARDDAVDRSADARQGDETTSTSTSTSLSLVVSDSTTGSSAAVAVPSSTGSAAAAHGGGGDARSEASPPRWEKVSLPVRSAGLSPVAATWDSLAIRCDDGGRGCLFYVDNLVVRERSDPPRR